jgi:hypothetical protein
MGLVWTALAWLLGNLVAKVVFALGIGAISYAGADLVLGHVSSYLASLVATIPSQMQQAWTVCGAPIAINMLFAAYTTRFALAGASKLALKRPTA